MTNRSTLGGGTLLALGPAAHRPHGALQPRAARLAAGPDAEPPVHHRPGHRPDPDEHQGADQPVLLLLGEDRRRRFPQLKTYGVRVREFLEELAGALQRQAAPARHRSAAVLGRGGPRRRARRARHAGGRGRHASSTSDSPAPTPPTGTRRSSSSIPTRSSSSSTTSSSSIYQLANPKKPVVGWLSTLPMGARLRSSRAARCASRGSIYSAGAAAVRPAAARADGARGSIRTSTCWCWCIRRTCRRPRSSPSTSTRCAAATSWCSSIRSRRPITSGADPQNPMAAMGADKSSHLGRC